MQNIMVELACRVPSEKLLNRAKRALRKLQISPKGALKEAARPNKVLAKDQRVRLETEEKSEGGEHTSPDKETLQKCYPHIFRAAPQQNLCDYMQAKAIRDISLT
ncbi:hypothetical protein JTB14_029884 [Gonioctena quinquepunctata]|nr:hypothetical protein JTB14_029884 [Gonioctena quinquepunctata]